MLEFFSWEAEAAFSQHRINSCSGSHFLFSSFFGGGSLKVVMFSGVQFLLLAVFRGPYAVLEIEPHPLLARQAPYL